MALPNEIHPFLVTGNDANQYKVPYSLRFRASASAYLNRSYDGGGYTGWFCYSFWVKRGSLGSAQTIHSGGNGVGAYGYFGFTSGDAFTFTDPASGVTMTLTTTQLFRDPSAWYHFFIQVDTTQATASNRVKIFVNGSQVTSFSTANYPNQNIGLNIAYTGVKAIGALSYTGASPSNYFDGYISEFYKISGYTLSYTNFTTVDNLTGQLKPIRYAGSYGADACYLPFNNVSLSTNIAVNATATAPFGGTAANALTSDSVYLTSNTTSGSSFDLIKYDFGSPVQMSRYSIGSLYFTGGLSTFQIQYSNDDVNYTVLTSLSVTGSGQNFSGNINVMARYIKIRATTFGTNGQGYIDLFAIYQDGLGLDAFSYGNNFTPVNISVTSGPTYDSMYDSPTNYDDGGNTRGNYCVLNPIPGIYTGASSNGNLTVTGSSSYSIGTIAPSSGKWYFEAVCNVAAADGSVYFDIRNIYDGGANEITYYASGSTAQIAGSPTFSSYTTGDIVACAYDIDNNTVAFYKNGVLQGSGSYTPSSSIVGLRMTPAFKVGTGKSGSWEVNFGQRPFAYTPPSGFKTLNTFNLANPSLPLV